MDSIRSGLTFPSDIDSIELVRSEAEVASESQPMQPFKLVSASLSRNARLALDQTETQPDPHLRFMAKLVYNGIAERAINLCFQRGLDVHYEQLIKVPMRGDDLIKALLEYDMARLKVRARLNEQAQYDIIGIDLHVRSSGRTASITLSTPPPAAMNPETSLGPNGIVHLTFWPGGMHSENCCKPLANEIPLGTSPADHSIRTHRSFYDPWHSCATRLVR